jgi:hypothetical protein
MRHRKGNSGTEQMKDPGADSAMHLKESRLQLSAGQGLDLQHRARGVLPCMMEAWRGRLPYRKPCRH